MLRIYLTEAFKNIKANITLSVIIVLLFTFLIQIVSYSFAWVTYNFWSVDIHNSGMENEAYIKYSVYSLGLKSDVDYDHNILRRDKLDIDPETHEMIRIPITEEDKAYNQTVIDSYHKFIAQLNSIDGYIFTDRDWKGLKSDNGKAYHLSQQGNGTSSLKYGENEVRRMFFTDLGYTVEEISQFCDYEGVWINKNTILMEGFTYCEGEGFTEDTLKYEYLMTEDGTMPTIPIVMGFEFIDYFDIGDVINNPEGDYQAQMINKGRASSGYNDQFWGHYVVVGFLAEDTTVEYGPGVRFNVDDHIIIPLVPNTSEYFPNASVAGQVIDFYQKLPHKIIYIEQENELATVEALSKALSEDPVVGTYYRLEKNTQANAVYRQMYEKRMINYALIVGSTLIFCIAVIILIIVNKFNSNIKDTAIHRLVGATVSDSVKAYILEFAIYLLCADILSHYVYIIYAFDRTSTVLSGFWMSMMIGDVNVQMMYPLMIAIDILFLAIVAIVAYICSAKLDTATIIKGKE
ncbi:MAG: hypothetical protein J6D42_11165 [Clostridia bacterium]|nr:hypothetical protein [Clostridia bacterium]